MSYGCKSERLPFRRLSPEQEGLRELPFTADFERAEILEPEPIRRVGLGLSPELQPVQILHGDLAVAEPIE